MTLLQVIPSNDWTSEVVKTIIQKVLGRILDGKALIRRQVIKNLVYHSLPETVSQKHWWIALHAYLSYLENIQNKNPFSIGLSEGLIMKELLQFW